MDSSQFSVEEQRVLAAEDKYIAAELNRDESVLNDVVDDRFVFNNTNGHTTGKQKFIDSILKMNMIDQNISERTVLIEGNIALIFGTTILHFATKEGEGSVSEYRYTSTLVQRKGEWYYLALQMVARQRE